MKKVCKTCGSKTRAATKPGPRCATCYREFKREQAARAHAKRVEKVYGLAEGEYDALLAFQGGVCALCGRPFGRKRGAVDHNHRTGRVRGIIHGAENTMIGRFRDDPEYFERVAEYLRHTPAEQAGLDRVAPGTPDQRDRRGEVLGESPED